MAKARKETFGPYGGKGGTQWDDGTYSSVRELIIYASKDVIFSVRVIYDNEGKPVWEGKHGADEGGDPYTVKLDYPREFLVSISGYYEYYFGQAAGHDVVRSLTFKSNIKTYGPYGKEEGTYFESPPDIGKIVGLHGRSGDLLDGIGVRLERFDGTIPFGPFGGPGRQQWDDGTHTTVKQLIIYHDSVVESIQIEYDNNGQSQWSAKHGTESGTKSTVKLEPGEFIISISGSYETAVCALAIQTNKTKYGPYGVEKGKSFSTSSTVGKVTGFFGNCNDDEHLVSIGAYFGALPVGPVGGPSGAQWNDGTYTSVRRIEIFYSSLIDSIQFEYEDNGSSKWSEKHGESPSRTTPTGEVVLDFPGEYLLSVRGHLGTAANTVFIRSLTFESNKTTYGPFGVEEGEEFHFQTTGGKIIGFYGTAATHLYSLGAYLAPVMIRED